MPVFEHVIANSNQGVVRQLRCLRHFGFLTEMLGDDKGKLSFACA